MQIQQPNKQVTTRTRIKTQPSSKLKSAKQHSTTKNQDTHPTSKQLPNNKTIKHPKQTKSKSKYIQTNKASNKHI